jgi:hypothetical protein
MTFLTSWRDSDAVPAEYIHVGGHTTLQSFQSLLNIDIETAPVSQFPEDVHGMSLPATATCAVQGSAGGISRNGKVCCSKNDQPATWGHHLMTSCLSRMSSLTTWTLFPASDYWKFLRCLDDVGFGQG